MSYLLVEISSVVTSLVIIAGTYGETLCTMGKAWRMTYQEISIMNKKFIYLVHEGNYSFKLKSETIL